MKYLFSLLIITFSVTTLFAQNKTDVSLFLKEDGKQVSSIESETGDLYQETGHHGPAVENEWLGLRLYFDHKVAIDVYNKTKPQLELAKAEWYPTEAQQAEGWGADYYKAGQTVGLGGVRLWDGEKMLFLDPVSRRTARVCKEANQSYMEMYSEDVPYKNNLIDILIRVTVYSGMREAKVEAFAFSDEPVQFATGINYHEGTEAVEGEGYISTWGLHPEDVAAEAVEIGGAIIYDPEDFTRKIKEDDQFLLISKPAHYLKTWITAAGGKEEGFNSTEDFVSYVESLLAE